MHRGDTNNGFVQNSGNSTNLENANGSSRISLGQENYSKHGSNANELQKSGSNIVRSTYSSSRRNSLSISRGGSIQLLDDKYEEEIASQAGDIGDRYFLKVGLHCHMKYRAKSPVTPLMSEIVSPLATDGFLCARDGNQSRSLQKSSQHFQSENPYNLPVWLEYVLYFVHLAVFGILGMLTRYLLKKLFGPTIANVTSDETTLYLDLPFNMLGSFLMGWFGVVFKPYISHFSDFIAIGLSTGYWGSLTTFNNINRHISILVVLSAVLCLLLSVSGVLLRKWVDDRKPHDSYLWLACMVAPPGVWIRWLLARLNGPGLGREGLMKWIPFGTLIANVSAASMMAALAPVKKVVRPLLCAQHHFWSVWRMHVNNESCQMITTGIQFGFLRCLSTVSTFAAEYCAMSQTKHSWRTHVYTAITILPSFGLGTLIYSLPVWAKGYR
ncbi:hypothetical protein MKX01_036473 [Papaver californicum]|nr:hypothetical protein MKX01_036473 [Papaver californicum]